MKHLNINSIVDLREKRNRAVNTDYGEEINHIYGTRIRYYYFPIYNWQERIKNHIDNQFDDVYGNQALNNPQAINAYKDIFTLLLQNKKATVFTCDTGRDRTGVIIALIMMVLGYNLKKVINEYVLSGLTVGVVPDKIIYFIDKLQGQYKNAISYVIRKHILNKQQIVRLRKMYYKKNSHLILNVK